LKKYRDMLADLSALDGLTGIANRRQFDHHLEREWRRAAREKAPPFPDLDGYRLFQTLQRYLRPSGGG
jgi:GGDEF domain-containing protein